MQDRTILRHTLIYCRRMWCLSKSNTFFIKKKKTNLFLRFFIFYNQKDFSWSFLKHLRLLPDHTYAMSV
jgi:hypothetical protein